MKTPIIILHGWQKKGSDYHEIKRIFTQKGFEVFTPDMPGFGSEALTKPVMLLDDYVDFVYDYIQTRKFKRVILIGHSFGGRVAAKFALYHPTIVEKLVITGSPLIKRKLTFKNRILSTTAKVGKKGLAFLPKNLQNLSRKVLYRSIGEWDYYKAGDLQKTFVNIISEDISPLLPKILMPTLLVWGGEERVVPLVDGKEIAKRIPHAKLVVVKDEGHKLPYDNPKEFTLAVLPFLE